MLEVAIVGEPGSGKTTFLGLLYATQVRFGSDQADSLDRKSTRLNSSHIQKSRMPSSA